MLTRDLSRKLKAVVSGYRLGFYSKSHAKRRGEYLIRDEFETLLRVSRDRLKFSTGRAVDLPAEERQRLEQWRDGYIRDFGGIIDDVR